ncbi:MAG: mannose-6-phosphate isomerase [Clostridiales bacterium]|nr:mannose-6-phosphate isomerase [Clostridiales bacterium]
MYPIIFKSIYYPKIWGGRSLEKINRVIPEGDIGESFDISSNLKCENIALNGSLKGKTIKEISEIFGEQFLGTKVSIDKFPLLVKIISTSDKLSIQVHPDDKYAKENENDSGKTEAWYILDAEKDSEIVLGTNNCDKDIFSKAIKDKSIFQYLNIIKVKKGDFFIINSGTIHGIGKGIIILEIQQNSDLTYRVYDFHRGRELHVDKALDVIDFSSKINRSKNNYDINNGNIKILLNKNKYFNVEKYIIEKELNMTSNIEHFNIITCVSGEGKIIHERREEIIRLGDSYFIPANLGEYYIKGNLEIINTYPS